MIIPVFLVMILCSSYIMTGQAIKERSTKKQDERYRLHNKRKNFFDLKKDRIKLIIPVTDKSLDYGGVVNISSDSINAILVWIHGDDAYTACKPIKRKVRKKRIKISEILGLERNKLKDSLVVAIFNNDTCKEEDIKRFRDTIKKASSYIKAVEKLNEYNSCKGVEAIKNWKDNSMEMPKEEGGDVIGGNG